MTRQVVIVVNTKKSDPVKHDTIEQAFTYAVAGAAFNATEDDFSPTHMFVAIPTGDYTITVTKNGFSASAPFSVQPDDITFAVPDTLTVTVG